MWTRFLVVVALTRFIWGSAYCAAPLGEPGLLAGYRLEADPAQRPAFERDNGLTVVSAEIRLGPVVESPPQGAFQWYGLSWTRLNGQRYEMWILIDRWPAPRQDPRVLQYLWREPGWPDALNFLHEVTREPVLPRISLWTYGWPQDPVRGGADRRAPAPGAPERILLQGWPFGRVSLENHPDSRPPSDWTTVELHPDLLVGWISQHRDVHGRPHYRLPDGRYSYTEKTPADLIAHARAGCNFYVSHPEPDGVPEWVTRGDLYHSNLSLDPLDWPADLYRSNYWGFCNHIDEPGVHNWGLSYDHAPGEPPPEIQAVESLQRIVREQTRKRGRTAINRQLDGDVARGDLLIVESDYPAWEYEWATAWYQLAVEDGVGGIVDEDASNSDLIESYNMAFRTEIPPTVRHAGAIRVAVMRGAARNFAKKWGVAFYHPNEVKLKSASIPYFYEKGAACFWFWTGWVGITDNSGLPYSYQRYYASQVRQAFRRHPARDMRALLRAAKVAVVLPYGYTFTPYHMHRIPWLHLEKKNRHGVTYRRVLANAAVEVERLLRRGIEFDIAVDDPLFHRTGYDELIYAQSDGRVRIVRPGRADELLDAPRPVQRPDLGPAPRLSIEVHQSAAPETGSIRLKAVAEIGTGEWAGECPEPRINWEIYDPGGLVSPAVFPEYGAERTLELPENAADAVWHPVPEHLPPTDQPTERAAGSYTVRAAVADIFGRPAVAYRVLHVQAPAD